MGEGVAVAAILNRAVQLAALLIAAGGALFLLLHRAQAPDLVVWLRQPLATIALAGSALSALAIGLHGAVLAGTGMEGAGGGQLLAPGPCQHARRGLGDRRRRAARHRHGNDPASQPGG